MRELTRQCSALRLRTGEEDELGVRGRRHGDEGVGRVEVELRGVVICWRNTSKSREKQVSRVVEPEFHPSETFRHLHITSFTFLRLNLLPRFCSMLKSNYIGFISSIIGTSRHLPHPTYRQFGHSTPSLPFLLSRCRYSLHSHRLKPS